MREYRITKYNPINRVEGIYSIEEWTSVSDIGKIFANGVLTYEEYEKTENAYIDCCIELIKESAISQLWIYDAEFYDKDICFSQSVFKESDIRLLIKYCLQEKCWAKLKAKNFFIHFGYDYYMYVGTGLPVELVNKIAKKHGLFCEIHRSPHSDRIE